MAPRTMEETEIKPARAAADTKGTKQKPAKKSTPAMPAKKASPPAKKR